MVRFDYGVILVESLKNTSSFLDAKAVARAHKLSPSLMEKVAQDFRKVGWLESRRGSGGGYRLVKNINLKEIMDFFNPQYKFCPIIRKL